MREIKKFHKNSVLKPIVKYLWDEPVKKVNKSKKIGIEIIIVLLIIGVAINVVIAIQQNAIKKVNQDQYRHLNFVYQILLENKLIIRTDE